MNEDNIKLEPGWKAALIEEFRQPYMEQLRAFLKNEIAAKKTILPKPPDIFAAFNLTPLDKVKVVILGQDPYHGLGQAHGLCFSVKPGVQLPPSLQNIYKEMAKDLGIEQPSHGYLASWAEQGVFLLNAVLTVEMGRAASHQGRGWERFTDKVIEILNERKQNLVFVLWGSYAQRKGLLIDRKKHLVIESAHPSPLSAYRGFFGSAPFSKINSYLRDNGREPIQWLLPKLQPYGVAAAGRPERERPTANR